MINHSKNEVLKFLWLLLALAYPLHGIPIFRSHIESLHLSINIPLMIFGLIIGCGIIKFLVEGKLPGGARLGGDLVVVLTFVLLLFLVWHYVGLMHAKDLTLGARAVIKITMGIILFYSVVAFFPRDLGFLSRFWQSVFWVTMVLLIFIIYRYAFVFEAASMGVNLEEETRSQRNQLGFYLASIYPLAFAYFLDSRKFWKLVSSIPLLAITTGLVYLGSRGSWLSAAAGTLLVLFLMNKIQGRGLVGFLKNVAIFACVGLVAIISLEKLASVAGITRDLDYQERFMDLYGESMVFHQSSIELRKEFMEFAWESFVSSPLIGHGLMNSTVDNYYMRTHNDYLGILADMGILGLLLFLGILFLVGFNTVKNLPKNLPKIKLEHLWPLVGLVGAFFAAVVYFNFINAYDIPFFWILLGFTYISTDCYYGPYPGSKLSFLAAVRGQGELLQAGSTNVVLPHGPAPVNQAEGL